jgi:exonuclease III
MERNKLFFLLNANILKRIILFIVSLLFSISVLNAQNSIKEFPEDFDDAVRGLDAMRIVFYNAENLFDPADDTAKFDESFAPEGGNHWSKYKYWIKQKKIAQVISAVGGWEAPALVGLCEVENRHVLINLVSGTGLKKYKYSIIHHESPDRRGIDVALIYRKEKFLKISDTAYQVRFPFDTASRTRDILYVKGLALDADTIHIFVTHWPSKYGGAFVTIPKRKYVAKQIKSYADRILKQNINAKIIIMGDFNDTPDDESVRQGLSPKPIDKFRKGDLINLMETIETHHLGTHFYGGGATGNEWSVLDQMIVSSGLLDGKKGLHIKNKEAHIFSAAFLLENNSEGIIVPNRTFHGMKYHGGYSDHMPVYLDLEKGDND